MSVDAHLDERRRLKALRVDPGHPVEGNLDADVAIIGFGPVGQALAALLGRAGHRVLVVERFEEIYGLPRAVHLDHETMRLLQLLGLADRLAELMLPIDDYHWFGADGQLVLRLEPANPARSGWESSYMFFQPELEAELDRLGFAAPGVQVERGWVAEELIDTGTSHMELTVRRTSCDRTNPEFPGETRTISARWVVGADGANSFVRGTLGVARRDLGFQERWLVVDVEPNDMSALAHLPRACQWCDPLRPTTHMQSLRHRRWEFMLMPGEDPTDFDDPARVWPLLKPWFGPLDGTLVRSAVYEFRSMLAAQMRQGHALLVGDAAHLTPPFLGQGMCAGMRDALNLAWKLDLVLRGLAAESVLDSLEPERQPHNEAVITMAVELGKVLCQLDPTAAAERDATLRQAPPLPPLEFPPLASGVLHRPQDGADPLAGGLSVQGRVERGGGQGLFDDIVGAGFQLIVRTGDPYEGLSPQHRMALEALGVRVATLEPDATHGVSDVDGRLTAWLDQHEAHAVLVRPDFYVFGSVRSAHALPALIDDLQSQLHLAPQPPKAGATR